MEVVQTGALKYTYTSADFTIVTRNGETEVWTMKAFKPNAICMTPSTTEIKDRNWVQDRAALVNYNNLSLTSIHMLQFCLSEVRLQSIT